MLVDGAWIPTFPNARYLVAEKEWRYWDAVADEQEYGSVLGRFGSSSHRRRIS